MVEVTEQVAAVPEAIPDVSTEEGRDAWLEQRRRGIGGSDVAGIIGLSPWTSAYEVWASKRLGYSTPDNSAMEWGRILEPVVANKWARDTGELVVEVPVMWRATTRPWAIANVDRLILPSDQQSVWSGVEHAAPEDAGLLLATGPEILEVKTTNHFGGRAWDDDQAPRYHQTQVQHYLDVLGLEHAWLVVLIENRRLECRRIVRDDEAIGMIREAVDSFWTDHVEADVAPEADALSIDVLKGLNPDAVDKVVELPLSAAGRMDQRRLLLQDEKETKADKASIDARIMQWLGEANTGQIDGQTVVTWNQLSKGRPNKEYTAALEKSVGPYRVAQIQSKHREPPGRRLHYKTPKGSK